jgi:hypothetical protein
VALAEPSEAVTDAEPLHGPPELMLELPAAVGDDLVGAAVAPRGCPDQRRHVGRRGLRAEGARSQRQAREGVQDGGHAEGEQAEAGLDVGDVEDPALVGATGGLERVRTRGPAR